jgi:hypothetical protein
MKNFEEQIQDVHAKLLDIEMRTFRYLRKVEEEKLLLKLELFEQELRLKLKKDETKNEL